MFDANDISMKGTCNTLVWYTAQNQRIFTRIFSAKHRQKNKNIMPGPEKQNKQKKLCKATYKTTRGIQFVQRTFYPYVRSRREKTSEKRVSLDVVVRI